MSYLKMTIIGNLGRDAEIREVGTNRVISFSVAHSEKYRDRTTNLPVERTTWVNCSYWRDPDKIGVAQYLKKGTQVYIEGTPTVRTYTNNQGQPAASLECRVSELRLLGGGGGQGGGSSESMGAPATPMPSSAQTSSPQPSGGSYAPMPTPDPDFVEDDLPF